jgi:DNA polymerase-4
MEYYASAMHLSARVENGPRLEAGMHCTRAKDSMTFLQLLEAMWVRLMQEAEPYARIKKVSVTLHGLMPDGALQEDLLAPLQKVDEEERRKAESLSRALDKINHRFGRDSVSVGMLPSDGRSFSGTKIAFTRIPDVEEFVE